MKLLTKLYTLVLLGLSLCYIQKAHATDELRLNAPEKKVATSALEDEGGGTRRLQTINLLPLVNAMASSIETLAFPALNAIDLNPATRWSSAYSSDQWIWVEVSVPSTINRVVIEWGPAYGTLFRIQTSEDSFSWTTRKTVSGFGGVDVIDLDEPVTGAKFVRMRGVQSGAFGYSIREMEVRGILGQGGDEFPTVDLPQLSAVASSVQPNTAFVPFNAIDGLGNTRWGSEYNDEEWIYVNLGLSYPIHEVIIAWEAAFASRYRIEVSDDLVTWRTVYTESNGQGGTVTNEVADATNGTYVRIYGVERGTQWGYSIWEMQVRGDILNPAPDDGIVKASGVAVASSVEFDDPMLVASNAVDGRMDTRWASQRTDDQDIYIDLASPREVRRVILRWEAAYASEYRIQVSNNTAFLTEGLYLTGTGGNQTINLDDYPGIPEDEYPVGQFVRMKGIRRGTRWGYSLYEFEVYVPGFEDPNPVIPVLLNIVGVDVSSLGPENPPLLGEYAIDGRFDTRWASARENNEYITVELSATSTISQVELYWEVAYGSVYEIQVSTDGNFFTTAFSQTNGQGGVETLDLQDVTGRYVRMFGFNRGTQYGFSLWEIRVFGNTI